MVKLLSKRFNRTQIALGIAAMTVVCPATWAADAAVKPAQSASTEIEEVIVTATRHEESLQKVPIAITAISSDTLIRTNAISLQDVTALSPGIQIQPQFKPGDAVYQIRGQMQSDAAPSIDPSVGVYFDDIYIARSSGSLTNLLDVQRVEVLKGPQGTLFGKNTTGGAIRIVSNKPVDTFEGYVKASYESFDRTTLEAVLNVPMSDTVAARFAGQVIDKTGGYSTNYITGDKIDKQKSYMGRASFLLKPTTKLSVLLEGDYSKLTEGAFPLFLRKFVPGTSSSAFAALSVALESGKGFNAAAGTALLQGVAGGDGTRTVGSDMRDVNSQSFTFNPATGKYSFVGGSADPNSKVETWGLLANVSYDLGTATLKSITGYRNVDSYYLYDIDGTQFRLVDGQQFVKTKQWSEELLLNGKSFEDKLDWTVGGLYFHETPQEEDDSIALGALSALSGGRGTATIGKATNKSYGLYGEGTYKLTDKLSLTAGTRYSVDDRGFVATVFNRFINGTQSCAFTVANGLALAQGFSAPCSINEQKTFRQTTYNLALTYQIDPDTMTYVRTSRGYRSGGFNPRVNDPGLVASFKPEIVTDYEVGVKSDWLEHRLRTNVAVFHSEAKDVQNTVNGVSPVSGSVITLTSNVGKHLVDGVEMDVTAKPSELVSIDFGTSFLDARSKNPQEPDVTYVQGTPKWAYHLGLNVDTPFWDQWKGDFRVDVSGRDSIHDGEPFRNPAGTIIFVGTAPSITLVGARYTITQISTGMEVSIYGRNLTNKLYASRPFVIPALGLQLGVEAEPRVIGIELKYPFGAMAGK